QVQFKTGMACPQTWPFGLGLLDAVLAEHLVARGNNRLDGGRAECLGDGDQRHRGRIAVSLAAGARDLLANLIQSGGSLLGRLGGGHGAANSHESTARNKPRPAVDPMLTGSRLSCPSRGRLVPEPFANR